jgi:hypothetical protein
VKRACYQLLLLFSVFCQYMCNNCALHSYYSTINYRNGDIAPLLQLRGEYTVPRDLMRSLSNNSIGDGGVVRELSSGGRATYQGDDQNNGRMLIGTNNNLNNGSQKNHISSSNNQSHFLQLNNGGSALDVMSSLDPSNIETVSLSSALTL